MNWRLVNSGLQQTAAGMVPLAHSSHCKQKLRIKRIPRLDLQKRQTEKKNKNKMTGLKLIQANLDVRGRSGPVFGRDSDIKVSEKKKSSCLKNIDTESIAYSMRKVVSGGGGNIMWQKKRRKKM